jgi:hypothetical protein
MAFCDEVAKYSLVHAQGPKIGLISKFQEATDKRRGQNEVAQAQ